MRWRRLASSVVISTLPLALSACADKAQADPRTATPLVRAVAVQGAEPGARSFTGVVAPRVQSDLGFRVSGKVRERLVDAGQSVRRGQPLMRLDADDLQLLAQARQESVTADRARARQAADEEARYRDLRGTGAISASNYDQVRATAEAAGAQLKASEAQAGVARNALHYAVLLADADGVVMDTLAEPGQVVAAGQVVVRLAHDGRREAAIQLPETVRPALGSTGQATLFGRPGASVPATLRQLSQTADRQTRTFEARYVLDAALSSAPLGATVTLRLPGAQTAGGTMQVPLAALYDGGKGQGVWVIGGVPAQVTWRPVKVQGLHDDGADVSGLKAGERIVALGAHLLHQGERVRVEPAPMAAGAGARP
ncbi:efflux RND transporter periplasmic adaptor subunit [Janthinobacterium lividum]|uniref:efflux RND transporter periplasmic adaptor subunit n=1 Tax=Janthinobacterium lividum TaxID=29581 RepID=UPI0015952A99|nr:efflux RND transporter periplasmic adaptor subunit [Janthinobacterium lividum]QKY09441.1 efflux RND transporter periplasmic adaptor subunit [Janthinobacterium lividum]